MRASVAYQLVFVFLLALSFLSNSELVVAEDVSQSEVEKRASQVYQDLLSPFCPGRSLKDCPSSKAEELKNSIKTDLSLGRSQEEVYESVVAQFGEQYRAVPKNEGFGRLVWLAPLFFLFCGGAIAYFFAKKKVIPSINAPLLSTKNSYSDSLTSEQRRVIEEELNKLQ